MTMPLETSERLLRLPGRGLAAAGQTIVAAAEHHGYSVASTGQGTYRLVRSSRPKWATIAAIVTLPLLGLGLAFLFVKQTEHATVTVFDDRDGTKARVVGDVSAAFLEAITAASAAPRASTPAATMPPPAPDDAPVFPGVGSEPDSGGGAAVISQLPVTAVPDTMAEDRTVARSELVRPRVPQPAAPLTGPVIVLPDGRKVEIDSGVVLGRDPATPQGWPSLKPISLSDGSVSKTHAAITMAATGPQITDLHSTNGCAIRVGGDIVPVAAGDRVDIPPGAMVLLGDIVIGVQTGDTVR